MQSKKDTRGTFKHSHQSLYFILNFSVNGNPKSWRCKRFMSVFFFSFVYAPVSSLSHKNTETESLSQIQKVSPTCHDLIGHKWYLLCHKWPRIYSTCCYCNLHSFPNCDITEFDLQRVINTKDPTFGVRTSYPPRAQ